MLVDIALPGRVFRFTSGPEALTVTNQAGDSFLYAPGLSRINLERVAGEAASGASVEVYSSEADSWARLAARGHRYELARVTIRHHYAGQTLEEAEVYLRGRAVDPAWGDKDEPLTFTVERQLRAAGSIPAPGRRIDDQTFTVGTIDPEVYGATGPTVIGSPGLVSGSIGAPTTPAYLVQFDGAAAMTNRWLIAYHEVQATTVTLHDIDGGASWSLSVLHANDLLGVKYAYVESGMTVTTTTEGNEYRVAWSTAGSGGAYNAKRDGALRGAGEVLLYLLQTYAPDIRLDVGRMQAQRATLDAYKLDFAITETVEAWSFIQSNILPVLPVDIVETTEGIYFQHRRLDASKVQAVAHLDSTPETGSVHRTSRISGAGGDIANRITVRYGRGGEDQRMVRSFTIDATKDSSDDRGLASYRCAQSQRMLEDPARPGSGVRPLEIQTPLVYDDGTASRIARDKALELALPPRLLTVQGGTEWDSLDVNDVVTYTDDDLHLSSVVAIVRRKALIPDGVDLTLMLIDAPYDPARVTS